MLISFYYLTMLIISITIYRDCTVH